VIPAEARASSRPTAGPLGAPPGGAPQRLHRPACPRPSGATSGPCPPAEQRSDCGDLRPGRSQRPDPRNPPPTRCAPRAGSPPAPREHRPSRRRTRTTKRTKDLASRYSATKGSLRQTRRSAADPDLALQFQVHPLRSTRHCACTQRLQSPTCVALDLTRRTQQRGYLLGATLQIIKR